MLNHLVLELSNLWYHFGVQVLQVIIERESIEVFPYLLGICLIDFSVEHLFKFVNFLILTLQLFVLVFHELLGDVHEVLVLISDAINLALECIQQLLHGSDRWSLG